MKSEGSAQSGNTTTALNLRLPHWRALAPDIASSLVLAAGGFVLTLLWYERLSPSIHHFSTWDFWFESDPRRNFALASDRTSSHHHSTSHHPLFSLLIYPPVLVLRSVFKLSTHASIGLFLAAVNAFWIVAANTTLRLLGLNRLDAALFSILMMVSAASVFWFPVPETFGAGALSIMIVMLACVAIERSDGAPAWVFVLCGVVAMSITTTNWLVALAMMFVFLPLPSAISRATHSFILVLAAWAVEHTIFPKAESFLNVFRGPQEVDYLFHSEAGGIIPKIIVFFSHSIVMPEISVIRGLRLSVQDAWPGEGGLLTLTGAVAWGLLLALGCWGTAHLLRSADKWAYPKTTMVLILSIVGQFLVTLVFGIESFLYSAHFAPLLILGCALAALTPLRWLAVSLAVALIVIAGTNNFQRLEQGAQLLDARYAQELKYGGALAQSVAPNDLIVCGSGMPMPLGYSFDPNSQTVPPASVCTFVLGGELATRRGWLLSYDNWTAETIAKFAGAGARYFATSFSYGIASRRDFFDELNARYRAVARNDDFAIYDLQAARTD